MKKTQKERTTNIKEGDLVLFISKNSRSTAPYLMIVGSIKLAVDSTAYFGPRVPAYKLLPTSDTSQSLGAEVQQSNDIRYEDRLKDHRTGRKDIANYLRENNLEAHATWIENLPENPEKLPARKKMEYIPRTKD